MHRQLETPTALFDYFHEQVLDAHTQRTADLGEDTLLYLAKLLTDRARVDTTPMTEQTLAELHGTGAHKRPADQVATYRELGDRALYRLGCFQESISRRTVSPRYYADMGAAAYWRVQQVMRTFFSDAFGPVFAELALGFDDCVALLERVRDQHADDHPQTIMRLYQEWLTTGSPQAARRLQAHGLVIPTRQMN
jgi:hypothetical protein